MAPSTRLSDDDASLKARFLNLQSPSSLADLLDVEYRTLRYFLYVVKNYKEFELPKKSGGVRQIASPATSLKIIQQKLAQVFYAVYGSRSPVHGFVRKRTIRSNASIHLGAEWVLNFDLKDFFPAIHFGRVKGLFLRRPYTLPYSVAETLAQICCFKGSLPAGAPTSPILANMICAHMDAQLKKLSLSLGCKYTRYADDITISTRLVSFPPDICTRSMDTGKWELGAKLTELLASSSFQIQPSKTRVRGKHASQQVTGLRINSGLNISSKLQSQIRAMLHAWDAYGEEAANEEYLAKYNLKQSVGQKSTFRSVLRGKIEFAGFVKGRDHVLYVRWLQRFQELTSIKKVQPIYVGAKTHESVTRQSIWLVEDKDKNMQGTAFAVAGGRIFTAAHNLEANGDFIYLSRPEFDSKRYVAMISKVYSDCDVAELSIGVQLPVQLCIAPAVSKINLLDHVCVLGFPRYHDGDSVGFRFGRIVQRRFYALSLTGSSKVPHYIVDADIVKGNSGGPIVDHLNRVIGIALKGVSVPGSWDDDDDELSSFVPFSHFLKS